ncbi:MAG: hypothetical protein WC503_06085 [Candidatus Shapirobacteria bacterium]
MRPITIPLEELLDLLSCAEDYGFDDDIFYNFVFSYINPLTDEEIEEFAQTFLTEAAIRKGYGEEDYQNIKYKLTKLKETYTHA